MAQQLELLKERAKKIKLLLTDVDGVLTDAGVYYSESGETLKRFNIRDGMGAELLRNAGIETAIITRELSPSVKARGEKLKLIRTYLGVQDKKLFLSDVLQEHKLTFEELAYIGDDYNDLPVMNTIAPHGLVATPADGIDAIKRIAHLVCGNPGGHGAFRDFAEWLLTLRGQLPF